MKIEQQRVLENGFQLSHILNRTIIFPKFFCGKRLCNFHDLFGESIKHLDQHFELQYREHMFLSNDLVPHQVKNSKTIPIIISNESVISKYNKNYFKDYFAIYSNISVITTVVSKNLHFIFEKTITTKFQKVFG